jgi:hypothetical protein
MDGNKEVKEVLDRSMIKQTQQVKDWLFTNKPLVDHALSMGVTHLRLRRVGSSLVIQGFRVGVDEPVTHPLSTEKEEGWWFAFARTILYHAMPPRAKLIPKEVMTAIAHPEFFRD